MWTHRRHTKPRPLWGIFCVDFQENWAAYNGTALYYQPSVHHIRRWFQRCTITVPADAKENKRRDSSGSILHSLRSSVLPSTFLGCCTFVCVPLKQLIFFDHLDSDNLFRNWYPELRNSDPILHPTWSTYCCFFIIVLKWFSRRIEDYIVKIQADLRSSKSC